MVLSCSLQIELVPFFQFTKIVGALGGGGYKRRQVSGGDIDSWDSVVTRGPGEG